MSETQRKVIVGLREEIRRLRKELSVAGDDRCRNMLVQLRRQKTINKKLKARLKDEQKARERIYRMRKQNMQI